MKGAYISVTYKHGNKRNILLLLWSSPIIQESGACIQEHSLNSKKCGCKEVISTDSEIRFTNLG